MTQYFSKHEWRWWYVIIYVYVIREHYVYTAKLVGCELFGRGLKVKQMIKLESDARNEGYIIHVRKCLDCYVLYLCVSKILLLSADSQELGSFGRVKMATILFWILTDIMFSSQFECVFIYLPFKLCRKYGDCHTTVFTTKHGNNSHQPGKFVQNYQLEKLTVELI
mgnify:CR=1 FL=1